MIENKLKQCCEECRFIEINSQQEKKEIFGEDAVVVKVEIWCEHMQVCKTYIESLM